MTPRETKEVTERIAANVEGLRLAIAKLDLEKVRKLPQTSERERAVQHLLHAQTQLELAEGWLRDAAEKEELGFA